MMRRALASAVILLFLLALPLYAAPVPVSGRVVDAQGKATPNAKVLLIPIVSNVEYGRLELEGKANPEPAVSAATDAAGAFRLAAPDAGMWKVLVDAPGFVPQEALLLPLLEEIELPEAQLARDIRFQARVTDPQGKPVAGARIQVTNERRSFSTDSPWRTAARLAVTDASGAATLPRGADESLLVRTVAPGFPLIERKNVREGSAAIRLAAGHLRPLQVRDAKGKPAAGVLAIFDGGSSTAGRTSEAGALDLVLPDRDGVELILLAQDGRRLSLRLKPVRPGGQQDPDVAVLPALTTLAGRVVSSRDGRPVAGALAWTAADFGAVVRTGADGSFRLPMPAANAGFVHAAAPGFFPQNAEAAEGQALTLSLQPVLTALAKVVDESGQPVSGAGLRATYISRPTSTLNRNIFLSGGFFRSGESGQVRIGNLMEGVAYSLRITKPGFAPAHAELPAREAGQAAPELRIVLRAGRTAFGSVVDGGQRPVAGARVTLQAAAPSDPMARIRQARNPERFEGATDASGRFEVSSLPAGTFDLTVRGRGFAPLTVPGLVIPEGKGRTDLGTVSLAPGMTLRGLVTDPKGNPVAGAEVRASAPERNDMMRSRMLEAAPPDATTTGDGSFLLEDRAAGESLDLNVTHPDYGPGKAPGVTVPVETPVRIVLQPTVRVSGKVSSADGKPVVGAQVGLDEMTPTSLGNGRQTLFPSGHPQRAVTDDEGAFVFERVAPGPLELRAEAPRYQQAKLENLEARPGQELAGLEIVLLPGGVVEGRVLSPDGQPLPGAEVIMALSSEMGMTFSPHRTQSDGDGRYRLDGLPTGPQTLEARAEGYRRAAREVEVGTEPKAVDFQLERGLEISGRVVNDAGEPVPSVDIRLVAGINSFDALRTISGPDGTFRIAGVQDGSYRLNARKDGYATDFRGQPVTVAGTSVSGIEVRLSTGGRITGRLSGLEFSDLARVRVWAGYELNQGRVDPEGGYEISSLPPNDWEVTAVVPNTSLRASGRVTLEPGAKEARLDLQFGDGYELRGVVLRNGQPLPGASVGLSRTGAFDGKGESTDHQGAFRFGGLKEGTYDLEVNTPNGARHKESVEIAGSRDIRVELRTASLAGRVIDAQDLSPVSGARISLEPVGDERFFFPPLETDAKGTFRLLEVGGGAWKIRAVRDGYSPAEREIQVDGSAPQEIELALQPTEGVTIEALLPSGQAPDRIQIAVLGPQGNTVVSGTYPTGENGRTRLSNVPPGRWEILVQSDLSAAAPVSVSVPGPAVRVVLPPSGRLRIKVPALASDRTAKIVLTGPGGPFRAIDFSGKATSEWDLYGGEVGFTRVPVGVWQVTVRTPDGRSWNGTATVTAGGSAEVTLE